MKKKIIVPIFIIIITAAMIAGGTMSWFTGSDEVDDAVFTAGTVSIEAGQVINFSEEGNGEYEWYQGKIKPKRVVDHNCVGNVKEARTNPEAVLELETVRNDSNFFSLGFGGYVAVEFDDIIVPGDSVVVVVEDTWANSINYPKESAKVYASMDGEVWEEIGDAYNGKDYYNDQQYNEITMTDVLEYARYIKVVDTTNPDDFQNISDGDGFDVNAIYAEEAYRDRNMNWNPGDTSSKTFRITNTGTKDIHLRGKFSGSWYEYDEQNYCWTDWTPSPDLDVVTIELNDSGWEKEGNWFYYKYSIDGTYPNKDPASVTLDIEVELDGEDTDDQYQGKRYILNGTFEAIQASNGASQAAGWAYIPGEMQD